MNLPDCTTKLLSPFAAILIGLTSLHAKPADEVHVVLQGQSNAVEMFQSKSKEKGGWFGDAGFGSLFKLMVTDLTGIPTVRVYGDTFTPGQRTLVGGTYTFKTGEKNTWMAMEGSNPSTWPLGPLGIECDTYLRSKIRGNVGDAPVALLRIHSEYDSRLDAGDAAFYATANRNFVTKMREAAGLSANQMPVFYGQVPYGAGIKPAGINAIRTAWREDVANPAFNARYAWGAANDTDDNNNDNSHMDLAGCRQANARMALAVARWLFDKGYSKNDLSALPTTGPRIAGIRRGPKANQVDVMIQHDTGNDIVIPAEPNLGVFDLTDPGSNVAPKVTAIERISPATLRLTLDRNLSASPAVTLDYLMRGGFNNPGTLVTDNYHLIEKPAHIANAFATHLPDLQLPLARLAAPITIQP